MARRMNVVRACMRAQSEYVQPCCSNVLKQPSLACAIAARTRSRQPGALDPFALPSKCCEAPYLCCCWQVRQAGVFGCNLKTASA